MSTNSIQLFTIDADHSLRWYARAGSVIHIASGKAYLHEAPRWLAETMMAEPRLLLRGSVHVVENAGWVTLHTFSQTELCYREAKPTGWLDALWQGLLNWKRVPDSDTRQQLSDTAGMSDHRKFRA